MIGSKLACGVVLAGMVLAACGGSGSKPSSSSSSSSSPSSTVSSPLTPFAITAAQANQADPNLPVTEEPALSPTSLTGSEGATLDVCGDAFPSESLRTQRLQVAFIDSQQHPAGSNELVRYKSAAAAMQAYQELKAAVADCTKPWTLSQVQVAPADGQLLPQQVIISGQAPQTRINGIPIWSCFIWQFRGDMLTAVYVNRMNRDQAVHVAEALAVVAKDDLGSAS